MDTIPFSGRCTNAIGYFLPCDIAVSEVTAELSSAVLTRSLIGRWLNACGSSSAGRVEGRLR